MKKFKKAIKGLALTASMLPLYLMNAVNVYASDLDWIKEGDSSGGMLSGLVSKVKSLGQDLYTLLIVIGGLGMILCGVIAGISISANKSGQKKEENKGWIFNICIGGVVIFGIFFFVGVIKTIGESL